MTINNNEKFWELNYTSTDHNNEYKFYEKFATFSKQFSFDDLNNSLQEGSVTSNPLNSFYIHNILKAIIQVRNVHYSDNLSLLHHEVDSIFNTDKITSDSDLFFSFNANSTSLEHIEDYDIFCLNLFGSFSLIMENLVQPFNVGDAFYMPKDKSYNFIGSSPFIIFSFGLRGDISRFYSQEGFESLADTP